MICWRSTKAKRVKGASTFLALVLCFALVALPGCTYSVDDLPTGQTGVDLGVEKPSAAASPADDDTPDPNSEDYNDIPIDVLNLLPIGFRGPQNDYSIDPRETYPMNTALRGVSSWEQTVTASVIKVVVTDHVPDGFYKEPKGTLWDHYPNYYKQYYPETCYMFVTFELTNKTNTTNYEVIMLNGSMVFLTDDAYRIRWNTIWPSYPLYYDYDDDSGGVILLPNQVREVTLGYLVDKQAWFTETGVIEGWHFFVGARDAARHKSWDQPVIGYYGWLIDDDAVIYQDFE